MSKASQLKIVITLLWDISLATYVSVAKILNSLQNLSEYKWTFFITPYQETTLRQRVKVLHEMISIKSKIVSRVLDRVPILLIHDYSN